MQKPIKPWGERRPEYDYPSEGETGIILGWERGSLEPKRKSVQDWMKKDA